MIKRSLGEIAAMCGGTLTDITKAGRMAAGVTKDTRGEVAGRLYIPLVGERFDGHDYAEAALAGGAAATLWEEGRPIPAPLADGALILVEDTLLALQRLAAAYRSELPARIIGVTGSNGKTTTKDMVASVLSGVFRVHKTAGNLNNHIGLPLTVLQLNESVDVAVLEMGMSDFGEIELLTQIAKPDVAIITNIGDSHLLQLGSRSGIARAKLEIASGLRAGGTLLYNGDEPLLRTGVAALNLADASINSCTFGFAADNDWVAGQIELEATATRFSAIRAAGGMEDELTQLTIPVAGRHNVSNALAAIAAARLLGLTAAQIRAGLQQIQLTGMRIEPLTAYNGALLLSDVYNASPTATRAAIDLVEQLTGYGRKWLVLGDMLELGPQELELHRDTGKYISADKADAVLTFGPLAEQLAAAAAPAFGVAAADVAKDGERAVKAFADKQLLIAWLRARLAPEDLVLVKGSRGMRMEEIVHALQSE
ncbi:UDP-N-acetylmuramoyl-tripeptide--D-alanyl-D-alanine ligase [Paenibacillus sp. GCM10027626]|uniref:UDP-N-acetylmuramoyl-tripeptide--D-alanyl-D- alanine ligase n=1 Tax=Paenibacillus sp. GCM10027626 TaxID=3273411 RepID=UPI0036346C52